MTPPRVEPLDSMVLRVPTPGPEADGTFAWDATTVVIVQAHAGGRTGLGYTYGAGACATLVDELLAEVVRGADALDVPGCWSAMVRAIRNNGRPGIASMAIAAVDVALWDLKARLLDTAVCTLLGRARAEVPIYGSGGFTTYSDEELGAELKRWTEELELPRVKIKIGESWGTRPARDLERVRFARAVIGDAAELYVDANGAYSSKQAVRLGRAFAAEGVSWFEEPVSSDDLAGLAEVRGQCELDVAAGEYGYDLPYFERMVAAGAVDCLQADVTRCAGITEWVRVAALAAAHGLEISGHCAPALHAQVAAAVPNLRHLEYFRDHERIERLLFDGVPDPVGGALRPDPERPGLGLELRTADVERHRVR